MPRSGGTHLQVGGIQTSVLRDAVSGPRNPDAGSSGRAHGFHATRTSVRRDALSGECKRKRGYGGTHSRVPRHPDAGSAERAHGFRATRQSVRRDALSGYRNPMGGFGVTRSRARATRPSVLRDALTGDRDPMRGLGGTRSRVRTTHARFDPARLRVRANAWVDAAEPRRGFAQSRCRFGGMRSQALATHPSVQQDAFAELRKPMGRCRGMRLRVRVTDALVRRHRHCQTNTRQGVTASRGRARPAGLHRPCRRGTGRPWHRGASMGANRAITYSKPPCQPPPYTPSPVVLTR